MTFTYDVIVVGVGSMGSAACYYLAKAGIKVLGIEQFKLPHEKGSHTGESRFVRMAYFEDPKYVPLLKKAYQNWEHLEEASGKHLFHKTGIVYFGETGSVQTEGVKKSSTLHDLPIEFLNNEERKHRFGQFSIPEDFECLFEANAGYVQPELTIETYVELARDLGAKILIKEQVLNWQYKDETIHCQTKKDLYIAKKIIFTAGAWTQQLLPELSNKLQATQQALMWFKPERIEPFLSDVFSCWSITDPNYTGMFYGFPIVDRKDPLIKIAYHAHGLDILPDQKVEHASPIEMEPIEFLLKKYLSAFSGEIVYTKTCLYNYSPDEDFIIDFLDPYNKAVIVACGFSGHGFKFVPMIGQLLKDLALEEKTELPIGFLGMR